jgi:DNA-binding beta-propeller fold protein YncE
MPDPITPTNTLTSQVLGSIQLAGAEISAYDAASQRVFTTSDVGLQIIDLSDPSDPQLITTITFPGSSDVTSVATYDGLVAVAVPAVNRTDPGTVYLLDADGKIVNSFAVGSLPDMVTFSPDGNRILVANEGEATLFAERAPGSAGVNPEGSISVIEVASGIVQTAGFESFNGEAAALIAEGVRLFVNTPGFNNPTVAQDLEPEYIAVAPDGLTAWVTLQEANAVAVLDLSGTPMITDIIPLGLKDWSAEGLQFDPNDQDEAANFQGGLPVFGMYQPDAVASYAVNGETYYVLANEGDDRNDFVASTGSAQETRRVSQLNLDDAKFPGEIALKSNAALGRLNVSQLKSANDGDTDGDGDIDQLLTYGARSFSIRDAAGNIVFDSGDQIDRFVATYFPELYDDSRSDNKGSEPEGVTIADFEGRTYAFVALERYNSTIVYDITDPANATIATLLANAGDLAPESGIFVSAAESATAKPLFIVSSEESDTLTVYELSAPQVTGGNGQDELVGTISADVLTGGNSMDFIYANAGNDRLDGGRGSDELSTGTGADVVLVGRGNGQDVVTDFDSSLDAIQLLDGVTLNSATVTDRNGDGNQDVVLHFKNGGGTLVLLGVSDAGAIDFI